MNHIHRPVLLLAVACLVSAMEAVDLPVIDGDWWKIADQKPDLGPWTASTEDACDFTVFQAADGTWQLIGCVRGCAWPTGNRIFHRWESRSLDDRDWKPQGVFLTPDQSLNQLTAIQAPHGFQHEGTWHLFYNAGTGFGKTTAMGVGAYVMTSPDGRTFTHQPAADGKPWHFRMGRDINLFRDRDGAWYAYYCGQPVQQPGQPRPADTMVYRKAAALAGPWSDPQSVGMEGGNPESPFVLRRGNVYYLWQQLRVYISDRPDHFPSKAACELTPGWKYAPEIIEHEGRWYMAAYNKGLWMCRLRWEAHSREHISAWQATELPKLLAAEAERNKRAAERAKSAPAAP